MLSARKSGMFHGLARGFLVVGALLAATLASAQVKLTVEDGSMVVDAVTPGGQIAIVGVEFQKPPWRWRIVPMAQVVRDEDGDGRIVVPLPPGPGRAAVVIAVDLGAGSDAVATWKVLGGEAAELASWWTGGENGEEPILQLSCRSVVLLLVGTDGRLASAVVDDGSDSDLDGSANAVISINGEALNPLEKDGSSEARPWHEGDRVYAVGLRRPSYTMVEVPGESTTAGGGAR